MAEATLPAASPAISSSDSELLGHYHREGAQSAFRLLVERYQGMVLATAFRRTGNLELAREVAQEVFAALARKASLLNGRGSLGGWLHQAAVYEAARALQSENRRRIRHERFSSETAQVSPPAVGGVSGPDRLAVLDEALNILSAADREVIVLHYFQDLSYAEIARTLGAKEAAVRQRLSRALRRLGKHLRGRGTSGGVVAILLSAAAVQKTIAIPSGIATSALAAAVAGGGASAFLTFTAIFSPAIAKAAAVVLTLAGLSAVWHMPSANKSNTADVGAADFSEPVTTASVVTVSQPSEVSINRDDLGAADKAGTSGESASVEEAASFSPKAAAVNLKITGARPSTRATTDRVGLLQPGTATVEAATKPQAANTSGSTDANTSTADHAQVSLPARVPSSPNREPNSPSVPDESVQFGGLSDLISDLRQVELFPAEAAQLYSDVLADVLTLKPLEHLRVAEFLEGHYQLLNLEGLAGDRPPEIPEAVWRLGRDAAIASAVNGVEQALTEPLLDPAPIEDVFHFVEKVSSAVEEAELGINLPDAPLLR